MAVAALFLAIAGCAKKSTVVGKWKVAPEVESSKPAGLPEGFMSGFATTFKYEFKEDGTFAAPMSEGTYTFADRNISVTTKKIAGKDIATMGGDASKPQMTGELSADGQTLTLHPPSSPGMPASLKDIKMVRETS